MAENSLWHFAAPFHPAASHRLHCVPPLNLQDPWRLKVMFFPRQRRTPTPQREMTKKTHKFWNYNNALMVNRVTWSMFFFGWIQWMKSIFLVDVLLTNIEVKAICLFVSRNMLKTKETNVTSIWTGLTTAGKQAGHHPKSSLATFALNPKSVKENPVEKHVPWRSTVPSFYDYLYIVII